MLSVDVIKSVLRDSERVWNKFEDGFKRVKGSMIDDLPIWLTPEYECYQTIVDGCYVLQVERTPIGYICESWHVHNKENRNAAIVELV